MTFLDDEVRSCEKIWKKMEVAERLIMIEELAKEFRTKNWAGLRLKALSEIEEFILLPGLLRSDLSTVMNPTKTAFSVKWFREMRVLSQNPPRPKNGWNKKVV